MTLFIVAKEEGPTFTEREGEYNGYDLEKPSRAVVAQGQVDGTVLWYVGAALEIEVYEHGLKDLEDLGLEPPEDGIWVWEGRYVWHPGHFECPDDGFTEPVGEFRRPTDEEWASIRKGECPWNPEDWLTEAAKAELKG